MGGQPAVTGPAGEEASRRRPVDEGGLPQAVAVEEFRVYGEGINGKLGGAVIAAVCSFIEEGEVCVGE